MRLWWRKSDAVKQTPAAASTSQEAVAVEPAAAPKAKATRWPVAGMSGGMAISTEDGLQHPLAPRNLKPHDELSKSNDG